MTFIFTEDSRLASSFLTGLSQNQIRSSKTPTRHRLHAPFVGVARVWFALVLSASLGVAQAREVVGVVVGVSDGDTIKVLDGRNTLHKIRLAAIDAPEKGMPYGHASKRHLARLVFAQTVSIRTATHDRYGRTVGTVLLAGRDINLEMIEAGLAWHYKQYSRTQSKTDRRKYADAEVESRKSRLGLWQQPHPTPPWKWRSARRGKRQMSQPILRSRNAQLPTAPGIQASPDAGIMTENEADLALLTVESQADMKNMTCFLGECDKCLIRADSTSF